MDRPRSVRPTPLAAVVVVALLVPLAGCTGDDKPEPPATVTVTVPADGGDDGDTGDGDGDGGSTMAPTPTVTEKPTEVTPLPDTGPDDDKPFVANTEPDTNTGTSGALLTPTDLRFGGHTGYDRLVLDLDGSGEPAWRMEYVAEPRGEGSGEIVDLDGSAYLVLNVQNIMLPGEEAGQPEYTGPAAILPPSGSVIREVKWGGIFEGTLQIFIGVSEKVPFRAFLLDSPTRLVIDVQQP